MQLSAAFLKIPVPKVKSRSLYFPDPHFKGKFAAAWNPQWLHQPKRVGATRKKEKKKERKPQSIKSTSPCYEQLRTVASWGLWVPSLTKCLVCTPVSLESSFFIQHNCYEDLVMTRMLIYCVIVTLGSDVSFQLLLVQMRTQTCVCSKCDKQEFSSRKQEKSAFLHYSITNSHIAWLSHQICHLKKKNSQTNLFSQHEWFWSHLNSNALVHCANSSSQFSFL